MHYPYDEAVAKALGALGSTPDLVAANLEKLGHKGNRSHHRTCPVAYYLRDTVFAMEPGEYDVSVYSSTVLVLRVAPTDSETVAIVRFLGEDNPMFGFLQRFDNGDFTHLTFEGGDDD